MIRIHNFARGARGMRAIWVCEEMGLPYELVTVSYPPSDAYSALQPLGTVPFLEDEGGVAMGESVAMMLYLAHRYGPTPLLPGKDDPLAGRVLHLLQFGETELGTGVNPLLMAHFGAPEAEKRSWLVPVLEQRVARALAWVVDVLGDGPFLAGNRFTLADISVSTALGMYKGALGKPLPEPLVAYRERLAERPAYQRTLGTQQPR